MDIFNIIVGAFSILGSIASFISVFFLYSISTQQKNSGQGNSNQVQINRGKENKNTNVQY